MENFYVQLAPDDVFHFCKRLNENSMDFVGPKFRPHLNKPCLATFSDGKWYWTRIVAVSGCSATIHYFDFGNHCIVNTKDLRTLPVEFIEPPQLAIKCRAEANGLSSDIAEVFCEKLPEIEFLTIRCVNVVDGVLSVQIFHPNEVDFVEKLCMDLMPAMSGNIVKTRGFMI